MDGYSRYEDAMIVQQAVSNWSRGPGSYYLKGFFSSRDSSGARQSSDDDACVALELNMLATAEPVYVSVEACDLVEYALETFKPEAVLPSDAFTPGGFAVLARPLILPDAPWTETEPGRSPIGEITVRAIGWQSIHDDDWSHGQFWISYYGDPRDDEVLVRDRIAGGSIGDDDERVASWRRETADFISMGHPHLFLVHQFVWAWGSKPWEDEATVTRMAQSIDSDREHGRQAAEAQVKLVQCFWRLASQFRPLPERAPRGIWRDYSRRVHERRDVTVVRLRRGKESEEAEPAGRGLTIQFPVRGHWRNQWFPSIESHRQVWISPYVKGPDGAPFVCRPRAWEFTR